MPDQAEAQCRQCRQVLKPKEVNFLVQDSSGFAESEFFYLEADDLASGSNQAAAEQSADIARRDYMVRPAIFPCFHMTTILDDYGCATIDTGCQRMAIGINTLNMLQRSQPSNLPVTFCNETHQFRSVHKVSCTTRLACIPCSLGPRGCILRPAFFEDESSADAPFLLSLPFLLHCQTILHLDESRGLSMVSTKFGFKVACHLGPTGALRIPVQQFSDAMMTFLESQVFRSRDEYELLQTVNEHFDDHHNVFGSVQELDSAEQLDKSPALGAALRSTSNDAWQSCEARAQRGEREPVRPPGLGSPTSDDRVERPLGECSVGEGGGRVEPDPTRSNSEVFQFKVTNAIGMVEGDINSSRDASTDIFQTGIPVTIKGKNSKCSRSDAPNSRSPDCQHVGDPGELGCEQRGPSMPLRASCHVMDLQDRAEPGPAVLEVCQEPEAAMQLLPMADLPASEARLAGQSQLPILHEAPAGDLPPQEDNNSRNGLNAKVRCLDCGKLLSDEKTPAGLLLEQQKKERKNPSTPLSQGSSESQRKREKDNKEFQDFLAWRRAQEDLEMQPAASSSRRGFFM
eukprot:s1179_g23.t1